MSIRTNKRKIAKKVLSVFVIAVLVTCTLLPAEQVSAAEKLSEKEIRKYTQILETKQYVYNSQGLIYSDNINDVFFLYDINGDGREELIVSGALGLRNVYGTVIYSYDGSHFHRCTKRGYPGFVCKKGIELIDDDYWINENGETTRFSTATIYQLNADGRLKARLKSHVEGELNDSKWDTQYYKYSSSGKKAKISESAYKKLYKKYPFQKIKGHVVNSDNIKKYVNSF